MKYRVAINTLVTASGAGIVLALVFPPFNFPWPLAIASFVLWIRLLQKAINLRQAACAGLIFGLAFFLTLLKWIQVVGFDAWIVLALLCTSWWVGASVFSKVALRTQWWPIAIPTIWTSFELLRDRFPFGGFGWGQIGVISPMTPFANGAALVGQLGMTFSLVATASSILWLVASPLGAKRRILYSASAVILVGSIAYAPFVTEFVKPKVGTRQLSIGAVQGGVDHYGLGVIGDPRTVLLHHVDVTQKNAEELRKTDLVVWPENAADVDPTLDHESADAINEVQVSLNKPLLLGAIRNVSPTTRANVSLLWDSGSWTQVYQKRRLVPFGEFLPGRDIMSRITDRVNLMPRDFEPGNAPGFVTINGVTAAVLICFEAADDWQALAASNKSSVIIIQTNNATYQYLGESEQQMQSAQMRALETQRPVLVVSTSGISAVIDPEGRVIESLSQDEVGVLVQSFPEVSGVTPAVFMHNIIIVSALGGTLVFIVAGLRARRKVSS